MSTSRTEPAAPLWCQSLASISCVKAAFDIGLWDELRDAEEQGYSLAQRPLSRVFWQTLEDLGLGRLDAEAFVPDQSAIIALATPENRIKAEFQALAAADLLEHGAFFLARDGEIPEDSRVFQFFNYADATSATPKAPHRVAAWVDYLAYCAVRENDRLADAVQLPAGARVLEIGGNVGLFADALLQRHSTAQAVVFDLPGVIAQTPNFPLSDAVRGRLSFEAGDLRYDRLPRVGGEAPSVVVFKSVLHDWPDAAAQGILAEALDHLAPGGLVLIVERLAESFDALAMTPANAHNHAFTRFYRTPQWYIDAVAKGQAAATQLDTVNIDTGFFILGLTKTPSGGPS